MTYLGSSSGCHERMRCCFSATSCGRRWCSLLLVSSLGLLLFVAVDPEAASAADDAARLGPPLPSTDDILEDNRRDNGATYAYVSIDQ